VGTRGVTVFAKEVAFAITTVRRPSCDALVVFIAVFWRLFSDRLDCSIATMGKGQPSGWLSQRVDV
jgi:hypothetical protein